MCVRNPDLAGWAEAMCEKNGGYVYKIETLKPSPFLEGYRNKCKFRIGKLLVIFISLFQLSLETLFQQISLINPLLSFYAVHGI